MKPRGQISITLAVVGALGTVIASAFTAFATSNSNLAEVQAQVSIVEERENNHYLEVQKQLGRIEIKLDKIINTP